jgi:endoglycosylceramidase
MIASTLIRRAGAARPRRWMLLTALLAGAGLASPAVAGAGPTLPLGHAGRWITDATGRVVTLHGVNEVYKLAPYYPAVSGFGDDDAAFLAANGLDAVRVGVIWKALEPAPGVYDDAYLSQIAATVDTLARHGIVSMLDFHQDLYNERFQGEGAPDWAVQDDGLPNPPLGFPGNYLGNPALQRALDHFFNNDPGPGGVGLQDRFAAAWAHVAERFRSNVNVLGYEVLNEPFPGTTWAQCANTVGCPIFDAKLTAFERRVDTAVRRVDPRTLVWYEPNVLFNDGAGTQLGPIGDPHAGFAFHDYCLSEGSTGSYSGCSTFDDLVFANALGRAATTGDAVLETEWGATDDAATMDAMVQRADKNMVGWLEWAYTGHDITTSGAGDTQALVIDPAKPPVGANVKTAKLRILASPYPQVVAGTPESYGFDASSSTFTLRYGVGRAGGGGGFPSYAESDISVPAVEYPTGYAASARGGAVLSAANADPLRVAACPGASEVSVTVTTSGVSAGSCAAPAAATLPAAGRGCLDTRGFSFVLHHGRGARILTVEVRVNHRLTLRRRGQNLRRLRIARLPVGGFVVQITTTDSTGVSRISTRTYRGCRKGRPHTHRRRTGGARA